MLLLCVGPLLSQWLVPTGATEPDCSAEHGHHAPAADEARGHQALWAKCGYCTLLFSSPALSSTRLLPLGPARFEGLEAPFALSQRSPASPVFPGARSRAPPSRS